LKTGKLKREPTPIPIIETGGTKRKLIIGSVPLFKTEMLDSESEPDTLPVHSKYMDNVLKRKGSHDPTFGVYQHNKDSSFKIERSSFKYNDKHVFLDGKNYKSTKGLREILAKSKPDKILDTLQDRQAYKQILLQSNAHRVNYRSTGTIRANK
jgi:hypothetical protein